MTQYVINIGAIPNDGTGDPLRTAFNETNLNFNQVFAAGPVLSNIQIANNKILTTNTNGNLVLAPNGTGIVQSNVSIVPNLANIRNLGSSTQRWATVYTQYLNVSSGTSVNGNLTVDGNLIVMGNVVNMGNIVTDTLTIQLANTTTTANAANGAGITVGANDNIATILYNSTGNVWTTNVGLSSVGNITAQYFVGNGSQLTGLAATYGNANVVTLLAGFGSNTVSTTGDITAGNILPGGYVSAVGNVVGGNISAINAVSTNELYVNRTGNSWRILGNNLFATSGAIWTSNPISKDEYINSAPDGYMNLSSLYANSNVASQIHLDHGLAQIVVDNGSTYIWEFDDAGNLTLPGNTFAVNYANGTAVSLSGNYGNANAVSYGESGWAGNIIPNGNAIYSLGNATNQWNDLYVSNATIFMNNVPISLSAGNVLTVNGNAVLTNGSNTAVSTTGNITAGNIGITGGSLTWANASIVQTSASDVSITGDGQVTVRSLDGTYQWTFESNGNLTAPGNIGTTGNIAGNYFVGNGSQLTGIAAGTGNLEITGTLIEIAAGATETSIVISPSGPTGGQAFVDVPDNATANTANLRIYNSLGNIELGTDSGNRLWYFGSDGRLTFPGTPRIDTDANNFEVQAAESINFEANAVVNIYTDTSGTTYQWQFGDDGNLNLPTNGDLNFNGGSIAQTLNEDIYIRASDDENDGWSVYNVVDDGGGNILSQTRLEYNQYSITTDAQGAFPYTWLFRESGQLDLPGDIAGNVGGNLNVKIVDQAGSDTFIDLQTRSYVGDALISNIRIANPNVTVSTASGVYNWNFDNTGNLNLPIGGNIVGITSDNSGFIAWAGNSSGDNNGYTTMGLIPDDTLVNNDQYLIIDPTAPGHIHIRAGGTQDNSSADLFLGGENSYFRVASGANSAASVSANSYVWTYGTDGTFSLPAAESPGQYSEITSVGNSSGDGYGYATLQLKPDSNVGGDSYLIIDPTAPNHIHIRAGGAQDNSGAQLFLGGENSYFLVENGANSNVYVASNSNQWKFDTTGILTLPGEGVLQSVNDTVTLSSLNTTTGNANSVYLGSSGGLGFNDQEAGGNWLEIFRSGSDPEIRVPPGGGNILITGASGSGGAGGRNITITAGPADQTNYYTTAGGTVNIVGGLGATDDGGGGGPGGNVNLTAGVSADPAGHAGNVNITCGPNSWVFDYSGNVTIPGNINAVLSSPAPSLNGFTNVNAVNVNASGNISGGNLTVGSGTITGGNVNGAIFNGNVAFGTGTVGGSGNITGGNLITTGSGGDITMSGGNITGANVISASGTITSSGNTNGTAFAVVGNGAVSNVALGFFPTGNTPAQMAIRDYSTANSIMYFDTTIGSANTGGAFEFRSSNAYTQLAMINSYGVVQPTKPGFRVYGNGVTSGLTITTNGNGILTGNNWAVDYNQGSYLNSTTGAFTAPVAGLYQVNLTARCANNAAPTAQVIVVKNYGSANITQAMWEVAANTTVNHFGVSTVSKLAVGDTLAVRVTVGAINFDENDNWSVAFLG
jgi:hypothetical protein